MWFLFVATVNRNEKMDFFADNRTSISFSRNGWIYKILGYVHDFTERAHSKPRTLIKCIFILKFVRKLPKILNDKII